MKKYLAAALAVTTLWASTPAIAEDYSQMGDKEFAKLVAKYDMAIGMRFLDISEESYQMYKSEAPSILAELAQRLTGENSLIFRARFSSAVEDAMGKRLRYYAGPKMPATLHPTKEAAE